jgi:outer membrane protein OmpA-like peptidoglycan-associated protein
MKDVDGEKNGFPSPIKRGAMMIRSTLRILYVLTVLASSASAQSLGIDPNSYRPSFRLPLQGNTNADTYKRLPYQDLASEIRIELAADVLYDFDKGEVRSSAADYFQQAANLIFEEAKGPVRIECRSDRAPPAIGQKLAERCASAIAQWMIVQEKLTKVKFTTVGTRVPPTGASPNTDNRFAPKSNPRPNVTIVFAKK